MFKWFFGKPKPKAEFMLRNMDVEPKDLVKIEGVKGLFYIAERGRGREADGDGYFYGDDFCQFFFCLGSREENSVWVYLVFGATNLEWKISPVKINRKHLKCVEANISNAFMSRSTHNIQKEVTRVLGDFRVAFEWTPNDWSFV